jgi:hypothetical protein
MKVHENTGLGNGVLAGCIKPASFSEWPLGKWFAANKAVIGYKEYPCSNHSKLLPCCSSYFSANLDKEIEQFA